MDRLDEGQGIGGCFDVEAVQRTASRRDVTDPLFWMFDHHMAIHEDTGNTSCHARQYGRTYGNVRDEVTVHDIHVKPFRSSVDHALAFYGQLPKIRGKDGWRDDRARHVVVWEWETSSEDD